MRAGFPIWCSGLIFAGLSFPGLRSYVSLRSSRFLGLRFVDELFSLRLFKITIKIIIKSTNLT